MRSLRKSINAGTSDLRASDGNATALEPACACLHPDNFSPAFLLPDCGIHCLESASRLVSGPSPCYRRGALIVSSPTASSHRNESGLGKPPSVNAISISCHKTSHSRKATTPFHFHSMFKTPNRKITSLLYDFLLMKHRNSPQHDHSLQRFFGRSW
jgi:hypothetical protein